MFKFFKKVFSKAISVIKSFVKETVNNIAGVTLLTGAAIGFTKLASEVPFYIQLPFWIESTMVAPVIGLVSVVVLIHIMRFQMKMQGLSI